MENLIKVLCFLTIQAIVLMDNVAADPEIVISPSDINLGVTSALDINCAFSLKNYPDLAALISLSLSRANTCCQNFEELAVITQFSPNSVNLVTQEKVSATGVNSQTEQSNLQVTWEYPTAAQAGVYQCTAHGVDMLGHMVDLTNTSTVTVDESNLNDIFEKLKEMENRMDNHENSMENTISSMGNIILSMQNTISIMENRIQVLENTVTNQTALRQNIANEFELIGTYLNKEYYVSKAAFRDIAESEAACKSLGGTLIEINDENEYKAVVAFLKTVDSAIIDVMIGGTDEATEGQWLLPSTNQPLPYMAWVSGQPNCGTRCSCLGLFRFRNYQETMFDTYCHLDSPYDYRRYSCEIPSV